MELFFAAVVAMMAIGCGTGVIVVLISKWAEVSKARALGGPESLAQQVKALREEVRVLREQNADLVLSFDTAAQRLAAASSRPLPEQVAHEPAGTPLTRA